MIKRLKRALVSSSEVRGCLSEQECSQLVHGECTPTSEDEFEWLECSIAGRVLMKGEVETLSSSGCAPREQWNCTLFSCDGSSVIKLSIGGVELIENRLLHELSCPSLCLDRIHEPGCVDVHAQVKGVERAPDGNHNVRCVDSPLLTWCTASCSHWNRSARRLDFPVLNQQHMHAEVLPSA